MNRSLPTSQNILGVILAGGLGRRMGGGEKALVELAGRPLAAHVAARLAPQLPPGRLVLNANGPANDYARLGLPVICDGMAGRLGPLAGILAAIRFAAGTRTAIEWVLSAPTDTPFLPLDLVARLCTAASEGRNDIVLAASADGLCQVCGLWPVRLADELASALGRGHNKVLAFAQTQAWARVEFPLVSAGCDPFFNVNTPGDLARASELLQSTPQ